MSENNENMTIGFQLPIGVKQRKQKFDELMKRHPDIGPGHMLAYWKGLSDKEADLDCKDLDEDKYDEVASRVRERIVREMVRTKVREVVRKKPGGGGYVLYSPNRGKKRPAKAVGAFPTKLGAKRAELARFPPKDPGKLSRLRKEVDRLSKDPKKKEKPESGVPKKQKAAPKKKVESISLLRGLVDKIIGEALFHEDKTGSEWDETIGRLSSQAVSDDAKFQKLQKNIEKKTHDVLKDSLAVISKSVDRKAVKIKDHGIKYSEERGKTYLAFTATMDQTDVGPIYIYVEGGTPKIELSDVAKAALTKTDPKNSKLFRAELVTVQERVLDKMDDLEKAISARDKYLSSLETEVDDFVAELTPLQLSLLKRLLTKKYRKA